MSYISFQPKDYFNTKLYSGTGAIQTVSGVGFEPSWIWTKSRTNAGNNKVTDQVRGLTKYVRTNGTNAEETHTDSITAVNNDGFVLGADSTNDFNANGQNYVSWNWKANGQGSSNTEGFNKFLYLNTTDTETTNSGTFNDTAPSSSVITLGSWNDVNNSSGTYICYAFAEKTGYSKFGLYEGNGNADGAFVYTGFKPAMVIYKRSDGIESWMIQDNRRPGYNPIGGNLFPNATSTESTDARFDFLSNGFKARSGNQNTSGSTHIYMAFAEEPLVSSNGIPATAR